MSEIKAVANLIWSNTGCSENCADQAAIAVSDYFSDACASVQRERDDLREMLGEAMNAIKELLPPNVGWLPAHMPDSATLPLDVTFGEIRKARAFLARYEGGR